MKDMLSEKWQEFFGVHRSRVHEGVKLAREPGMEALKAKPIPGNKPKLNDQQQQVLTLWLIYPTCFWI
jgi:transposase